ncbi:hypothetical protein SLEP1_g10613 [Rubroshorea leprosula]|uniref:Uncharacterized protein n=1 Tax=Rubroshorea leprosula TaxID=152421 RepID=A0AAV5IIJ9_9ROSI|nr:hypothetical protein SLEP1_g10613 [Rubroshorea leprosula]
MREDLLTWIHFLSTKGVKDFVLENWCGCCGELPLSLFAFKQLHYLELHYCNIKVPSSFQGFGCLSSLILKRVSINGEELETLIQKCCALERLRFEDAKSLTFVDYSYKCNDPEIGPNLLAALCGLPHLESLTFRNAYDAFFPINENVVLPMNHLSVLHLYPRLVLDEEEQMRVFLFIIKQFPNLKKLNFSLSFQKRHFLFNSDVHMYCCFDFEFVDECQVFHSNDPSMDLLEVLEPLRLNKLEAISVDYDSHIRVLAKFLWQLITVNSPFLETLEITKRVPLGSKINENGNTTRFHKRLDKVFHKLKEVSPQLKIMHKARHEFSATGKLLSANLCLDDPSVINRKMMFSALSDLMSDLVCPTPIEIFKAFDLKDEKSMFSLKHAHRSTVCLDGPLNLNDINEVRVFLSILRGFPKLKELQFSVSRCFESPDSYKFLEDLQLFNFNKLQVVFLKGNGMWESIEDGFHPPMLPNNPTVAQMKQHADFSYKASYKAFSYIHSAVTDDIFSRIMGAEIAQEAWDTPKKEFDGNSRVKDKFESKISAIEESCDLKELTIIELISKLQAHEQRLVMKTEETTEGAFLARQKGKQPATSSESNRPWVLTKHINSINKVEKGVAKRGKLDETTEIGIFIGYATQAKGYKVYDPISKKVNVHKDVVFDESAHWNWDAGKIEKGSNKQREASSNVVSSFEITKVDDDSLVSKTKSLAEIYTRYGSIHKHKARLVVKGYAQQSGVDYGETYAPMARHDIVRLLITLAANLGWKLSHMDVKLAFLNGVLQEEIYVEQPLGFEITRKEDCVYKLNKALKYALDILKKFEMENCKPVATPLVQNEKLSKDDQETKVDSPYYRSLIGSLLYLTATRPDLMFAASYLSRFMSAPSKLHLVATKRVLRYIKGTYELGLWFDSNQQGRLQGYADNDWAGSMEGMISTTCYVFSYGSGSFSWNAKKQDIVAQSTAEAEYLAVGAAANHVVWLRMVLEELGFDQIEPCVLKVDNMSAIAIAQNPVQHGKTKHIKIKYHVIRNYVRDKEIILQHCDSEVQVADILTKALPRQKFEKFKDMLGVTNIKSKKEC